MAAPKQTYNKTHSKGTFNKTGNAYAHAAQVSARLEKIDVKIRSELQSQPLTKSFADFIFVLKNRRNASSQKLDSQRDQRISLWLNIAYNKSLDCYFELFNGKPIFDLSDNRYDFVSYFESIFEIDGLQNLIDVCLHEKYLTNGKTEEDFRIRKLHAYHAKMLIELKNTISGVRSHNNSPTSTKAKKVFTKPHQDEDQMDQSEPIDIRSETGIPNADVEDRKPKFNNFYSKKRMYVYAQKKTSDKSESIPDNEQKPIE
jgi:hypothetical protein